MSQNQNLGNLGQVLTVNAASNTVSVNSQITVGNTTMHSTGITVGNTSLHSSGLTINGTAINTTSFAGTANNTLYVGSVEASNVVSNSDLQSNLVNYLQLGGGTMIGDLYHSYGTYGIFLDTANHVGSTSVQMVMESGNNFTTYYGNNSAVYLRPTGTFGVGDYYGLNRFIVSANGNVGISNTAPTDKLSVTGNVYITDTVTVGTATVNATNYTATANNTLYVGSVTAANVVSNAQLQANVSTLQSQITSNASAAYTNAIIFAANVSTVNSGTLAEARLPYRMNQNVRNTDTVEFSGMTLTGNLVVSGNVNIIGANNLSLVDNMIYLNANSTVTNPDLGIAGNYNNGTYAHTGIFRDATDGIWKVFDNYTPEPDASPYIDTSNTTFHLANFQANTFYGGNTTANWFVANTSGIVTTGKVGIGTTSPVNKLHIVSVTQPSDEDGLLKIESTSAANAVNASLTTKNYSGTSQFMQWENAGLRIGSRIITNSGVGNIYFTIGNDSVAATLDTSSYLNVYGGITTPIFYDRNDTNYRVDPNDVSVVNQLRATSYLRTGSNDSYININYDQIWRPDNGQLHLQYSSSGNISMCNGGGYAFSATSFRSPIFYDSNDTAYYTDPASTSVLNYTQSYSLNINRSGSARSGISWYSSSYASWNTYMSPAGATGSGPYGYLTAPSGAYVTSWALRNVIEAASGYGWTWETCPNNGSTPSVVAELRYDGLFYSAYQWASQDHRAPIFYDVNNTGYYSDPSSTSNMSIVTATRLCAGYNSGDDNSVQCSNWFRSSGGSGWYNQSYSGGIYMSDSTYIRTYGGKQFYVDNASWGTIFYDSNDSSYYCDPNITTRINNLTVVGTGSRTLVATITGTGVASLATTSLSGYRNYEIVFENLLPTTQSTTLFMQWYGGGAYLTGAYYNSTLGYWNNNSGAAFSGSTSYIQMTYTGYFITAATGGTGLSGTMCIYNASSTTVNKNYHFMLGGASYTTGYGAFALGGGWYTASQVAITGFQMYAGSGNITGTVRVYGYN